MPHTPTALLDAAGTCAALPWNLLVQEIAATALDPRVQVPARIVMPTAAGACLFSMPAHDSQLAMTKLITFTPGNMGTSRATIQGDVVIFDIASGTRQLILDGPSITTRRTAAVSALAALRLAAIPDGPLLIIGAGAQGMAHLQAFAEVLGTREVHIASRTTASAQHLVDWALSHGMQAHIAEDVAAAALHCPLIVTCTPAHAVVLQGPLHPQCFVAAVGAFTPEMVELSAPLCQYLAMHGQIVVDSRDAEHEAGDLLQAGLPVAQYPSLADVMSEEMPRATGPVLFKSCGWGGWDLAAARLAVRTV